MWAAIIVEVFLASGLVWFFVRKDLMRSAEDKEKVGHKLTDAPHREF